MDSSSTAADRPPRGGSFQPTTRLGRLAIVLAGLLLGQWLLYGSSLLGLRVLLPLDILSLGHFWLPAPSPTGPPVQVQNRYLADLVVQMEPQRQFLVSELHSGRFPFWAPFHYAGAPFIRPKFSPFLLLETLTASPTILAWVQLLAALITGLGAYGFLRQVSRVGFWPAAVCAWAYPLTGFLILWLGCPIPLPVYWLPWLLWAAHHTARGLGAWAPLALAATTTLTLISGSVDIAGQILLGSGLFALWTALPPATQPLSKRLARLAAGWMLGFLLAAPALLPLMDYSHTGSRIQHRQAGLEERPPIGPACLPETVLPDFYGSPDPDCVQMSPGRESYYPESAAAAYVGVAATLWLAPLGFCCPTRRRHAFFWLALVFLGVSWCADVPGIVWLLRLPGLNLMSHNRLVLLSGFALLVLCAHGLEALEQRVARWHTWFWLPAGLLCLLAGWSLLRIVQLPALLSAHTQDSHLLTTAQTWYTRHYLIGALWCALALAGWGLLALRRHPHPLVPLWAAGLLLSELFGFASCRVVQCGWELYYPPQPVLQQLAAAPPGRIIGYDCLPANLSTMAGLKDVRGYDAVDPELLMDLMVPARDPLSRISPFSQTQWMTPKAAFAPDGRSIRLWPILDMLGVRYVIFRGTPPPQLHPILQENDYWVMVNAQALEQAFIPRSVLCETNAQARLAQLTSPTFDVRQVAFTEVPLSLPADCHGQVRVQKEFPNELSLSLDMATPGLVVLADLWDKGWQARLNGQPVPILRVNHALRGVVVPAGQGSLTFHYTPATWGLSVQLCALGALALGGWALWLKFAKV